MQVPIAVGMQVYYIIFPTYIKFQSFQAVLFDAIFSLLKIKWTLQ